MRLFSLEGLDQCRRPHTEDRGRIAEPHTHSLKEKIAIKLSIRADCAPIPRSPELLIDCFSEDLREEGLEALQKASRQSMPRTSSKK